MTKTIILAGTLSLVFISYQDEKNDYKKVCFGFQCYCLSFLPNISKTQPLQIEVESRNVSHLGVSDLGILV